MPLGIAYHVVAVHGNAEGFFAEQLFGDIGEARIVGQAGNKGTVCLHQRGVMARFAIVLTAFDPGIQAGVELAAVALYLSGVEELPEDQESKGFKVVELLLAKLHDRLPCSVF